MVVASVVVVVASVVVVVASVVVVVASVVVVVGSMATTNTMGVSLGRVPGPGSERITRPGATLSDSSSRVVIRAPSKPRSSRRARASFTSTSNRLGISAVSRPALTTRVITAPSSTVVSAAGSWRSTSPSRTSDSSVSIWTRRSWFSSRCRATSSNSPTTLGTCTWAVVSSKMPSWRPKATSKMPSTPSSTTMATKNQALLRPPRS